MFAGHATMQTNVVKSNYSNKSFMSCVFFPAGVPLQILPLANGIFLVKYMESTKETSTNQR